MKKIKWITITALISAFVMLAGCASSGSNPASVGAGTSRFKKGGDELDNAIREMSDYLNKRIPAGSKTVFLNIKSDWPDLSDYILSGLSENAVNDEVFTVVDRQQLDVIRAELDFQLSGDVSDASAQEIGEMLGAQSIVSGAITTIGSIYRIQIRAIAVKTAGVQGQFSRNIDGKGPIVSSLIMRVVPAGTASSNAATPAATGTAQAKSAATATPATPVAGTYKIGDKGPAGGLIFYDKGNNRDGWRYLEAAPPEAEFQAVWSEKYFTVDTDDYKTQSDIGSGKKNTQTIVVKFRQVTGNWNTAAQKANDLSFNGFEDWFLPSQTELDQIFGNLKRKNLGDFKDEWYWSSTEDYGHTYYDRYAYAQNFKDGKTDYTYKTDRYFVRPIRRF